MSKLSGKNPVDIRAILDSFRVEVVFPETAGTNKNLETACYVALNLLPRFLRSVRYVGSRNILKMLQPSHVSKLNLGYDEWNSSMTLVFGNEEIKDKKNPLYVASSGWSVYISQRQPCSWNPPVPNNLAALYAGGLSVGEVFKNVLSDAKSEKISHFEYDLITHGKSRQPVVEPAIPDLIDLDDLTIVGCGAVGQALCFGLKFASRLSGRITLVDHEALEPSNEQRYIGAFEETRGNNKAVYMTNFLININPALEVITVPMKYEVFAKSSRSTPLGKEAVVCVDNILTRLNVQGGFPKTLWNGWTDVSSGSLRYGIGRHTLDNEYECLSCAYFPEGESPSEMEMNSILTGLPKEEIQQKLEQNVLSNIQDIQRISQNTGIPLQALNPTLNRPFRELLHGNCGVFTLRILGSDVVAPAPHAPFLTGILLASQLILTRLKVSSDTLVEATADFDGMEIPNSNCLIRKRRNPKCVCNDPVYKKAFEEKWSSV